jgi:7-keto-8-aminopelargonate synthetase-like enzyme
MSGHPSAAPGRTIDVDGRTYLFFSGYAYLGMSHIPAFTDLLKEGIDRYGALYPSSRISNTPLPLYAHLEHYLAQLTGSEATVTFASGFLACQAIGQLLAGDGEMLVAPGTHPATGLGPNTAAAGGSAATYDAWCTWVLEYARSSASTEFVLVADSVAPLEGVIHDFMFLQDLPRDKHFTVLIDDAHGIGWMGEHGEGISGALMHLPHVDYVLVYSLSKALHVQGGAVGCSRETADRLRRSPFYTASTAMAPAFAHTLLQAGPLYEVQRAALARNVAMLTRLVNAARVRPLLSPTPIPVFLCREAGMGAYLEKSRILVSSFAYPDPEGPPVERVVVSALHEERDLKTLIDRLLLFT